MKQAKLAVLSHCVPLQCEKIEKVAKWVKLVSLSHSAPHQWEKIGKVAKQVKLGEMGGTDHSELFCATFVGNDWKSCEAGKISHSVSFIYYLHLK